MIKPDSLRTHLTQALPQLSRDPDRLLLFIDQGTLAASFSPNLSFEWRYTLNLIVTDFAGDPDGLMIALLAWVHDNQSDLLLNPDQHNAIQFEAEILNNTALDLSIKLPLTERVVVKERDGGGQSVVHAPEPMLETAYTAKQWAVYAGDALVCQWNVRHG